MIQSNTITEYGDYESKESYQAYNIIKIVEKKLGGSISLNYKHFPLLILHSRAFVAAEAAETAGAQGKFWEMHEWLFEHQSRLLDDALLQAAAILDLDLDRFRRDMALHRYAGLVIDDIESGTKRGVTKSPTVFINEEKFEDELNEANLISEVKKMTSGD
jgi:protein-disulfide isomerase